MQMKSFWFAFFSFQVIYEGSSHFFKVNKLQETTNYNFRIYASNDVGSGPYSEIYTFSTTKAPPPAVRGKCMCTKQHTVVEYSNFFYILLILVKMNTLFISWWKEMGVANVYEMIISAPRVSNLSQQTCSVEWQPCKAIQGSSLEYVLQLQGEQEYQKVSETKMITFTYEQSLRMYNYLYDCCIHQVFLFWFEKTRRLFSLNAIILWGIVSAKASRSLYLWKSIGHGCIKILL